MELENIHIPVMPKESIALLNIKEGGIYLDATLGGGGHTTLMANSLKGGGKVIAIDQDIEAIKRVKERLTDKNIFYFNANFKDLDQIFDQIKIKEIDGAVFDLGFSNYQLKDLKRGFSFSEQEENLNSPLDMRMDFFQELTASQIINNYQEKELTDLFLKIAEEPYPYAKKIASRIISERKIKPIQTVGDLLKIIKKSTPPKYRFRKAGGNYATNIFRALRIEVNQELDVLKVALPKAVSILKKEGRLVVISFHSLEDRIVKHFFKEISNQKIVKVLTPKPVLPSTLEIKKNPKSKSAKLRAVEKI